MEEKKNPEKDPNINNEAAQADSGKKGKRHLIHPTWLRRVLKTFLGIIIAVLLIPVLLYIPPVQTFVKNQACKIVEKSTGMKIEIGTFRLKFPLDVNLKNVLVLDQKADTMVRAKNIVADVKVLPLLALDVKLNKLSLEDGYYRMVSPDSSMIMSIAAGMLEIDGNSSANIRTGEIDLNKALLRKGNLKLFMNVWKQKQTPKDSTSTPFVIKAGDLQLEDFSFAMSMLPTIDTLYLHAGNVRLDSGLIDLGKNSVSWKRASVANGSGAYITPTPEWVAAHPAPVTPPSDSAPMIIKGDSISLDAFKFIYAMKGAEPLPGFDASYISVADIGMGMKDFYNAGSTVKLPITRLQATERSGLQIVSGRGIIGVDSTGLALKDLNIQTLYSKVKGNADIPFALMELKPDAAVNVNAEAFIGLPDVDAFMPLLREYTSMLPARNPLEVGIEAEGTLSSVDINKLDVIMRDVLGLKAQGYADNPLDIKKMEAEVDFEGYLADPRLMDKFTGKSEIKVPAFNIEGTASAMQENYSADFTFTSTAGDASGEGHVGMNSEKYDVNIETHSLDISKFMPSLGIGKVTATVSAQGAGFNPLSGKAVTDASVDVKSIVYNHRELTNLRADVTLHNDNSFVILANSANSGANFEIEGTGTIHPDDYKFDLVARLRDIDLQKLGMSEEMNSGKGIVKITGTASPERWLYDADLSVTEFDWNLPNQYIHLPGGLTAHVSAEDNSTSLNVASYLTDLNFTSPTGLKLLIDQFTKASDIIMGQIAKRDLQMDTLSKTLPPFTLAMNASGRGVLNQFLVPSGMSIDTVYGVLGKDSLFAGNFGVRNFTTGSLTLDTIGLDLSERRNLMDYKIHVGNRPGTLDEFAQVNINGYLGANRFGAYLTQRNIKGDMGYRLGLTGALNDSVVSVHLTPLKSTIAYLPWQLNADNYVDYNLYNSKINANLEAKSSESSILLRTEPTPSGVDGLHVKLDNIHIQDFLSMSLFAPPITGSINSDLQVVYDGSSLYGGGTLDISQLTYEKYKLGDFNLGVKAGMGNDGHSGVDATLNINGKEAVTAYARLRSDSIGLTPDSLGVTLTQFPLNLANPFLNQMATLSGSLTGSMRMDGTFTKPLLNGYIAFNDGAVNIPMAGCTLKMDSIPVNVVNSVVDFNNFSIYGANKNPITLDGRVDATSFSNILLDLNADAKNFQLVNSNSKSQGDLYGKLYFDLGASVKGSISLMDIKANLNILGTTDATYRLNLNPDQITGSSTSNVVKFVNFNDTTQVVKADSLEQTSTMRIRAGLTISPGAQFTVLLMGSGKVQVQPTANLNYFQNYMGDMRLNGNVTLGNGFVRYNIPVIGEKMFDFDPSSQVVWSGDIMNPKLNIIATDDMKASVTQGSVSRLVNFIVSLNVGGSLSAPKVSFDLSTNDDLALQNELASMSADQRMTQAMNMLLYGSYVGQNTKGTANTNMLYGFLESQLNSWAAKTIKGVDLSFGIDQYNQGIGENTQTQTSYSYQVSKSLFNNRFKIQVGGNYNTDSSAEDNLAQNIFSDISAEYILKQTETLNMSVKIFRHLDFENILEGDVTETGAGFVLKRKLNNLWHLFRFRRKKKLDNDDLKAALKHETVSADTVAVKKEEGNE